MAHESNLSERKYVFVNRVYPPVGGATGNLLKDLAESLAKAGARVSVVTGRGPAAFDLPGRSEVNGVEIVRVGSLPFARTSRLGRFPAYALLYPQFAWHLRRFGAVDAAITMTDPPLLTVPCAAVGGKARKLIHWAQDIYPEVAEELGVIPRVGARFLHSLSAASLRKQTRIVAVGRCMRERLVAKGVAPANVDVIPNWSRVAAPDPRKTAEMRDRLGWSGHFVLLYSGNLGLAHDFDTLVDAARALQDTKTLLVFAGEGPRLEEVRRATCGLANVSFLSGQPNEILPEFLAAADAHCVTLGRTLSGLVVPSKVYGVLSCGRPLLYVGPDDCEVAWLVRSSGAGLVFANGDGEGLAAAVRRLVASPAKVREMSACASRAAGGFTLDKAVARWQSLLES